MYSDDERYYIIFPQGDISKISILDWQGRPDYELNDWKLASRQIFYNYKEAKDYAKELARNNGITFIPDSQEDYYLD